MNKPQKYIRQDGESVNEPTVYRRYLWVLILLSFLNITGCHKSPHKASSADPRALAALKPMGSATNNADLERKRLELEKTLPKDELARQFQLAEFYFNERRFIESAHLLSEILDQSQFYPSARNLLARCFFFLGNPDRTLEELEYIIVNQKSNANEFMDALYLMGAAVNEAQLASEKSLKKAIAAWETYMSLSKDPVYQAEIKSSLSTLKKRLANTQSHHQ